MPRSIAGESFYGLSRRHGLSRTPIRMWVEKYEAGAFDEEAEAADTLRTYEARIAMLERPDAANGQFSNGL